ncbi:helix-turn-helix transcriptional regulator [Streptomyces brevispora]|uniref:helix-turn-helix domain-containing protein n=1 Tax=Streptomyces brevispora TaxID=887462 RepID=UPI002E3560A5|nr:helix-turn-helix transcriptional regulator [Streptomyces brevispora]
MTQESDVDSTVRMRIRRLRQARGWSLDSLAERAFLSPSTLSPSTLSRIETGHRRISLDRLTALARAPGTSLDQLVETVNDDDIVIRPQHDEQRELTTWVLTCGSGPADVTVARMRITDEARGPGADQLGVHRQRLVHRPVGNRHADPRRARHPGRNGAGGRVLPMVPHTIKAHGGPAEILCILDHDGQRAHLHPPV